MKGKGENKKGVFEEWMKNKGGHSCRIDAEDLINEIKKISSRTKPLLQKKPLDLPYSRFLKFVEELPLYTPKELYVKLEELGYRGQEKARKLASVMAYRHIKRIKMIYQMKIPPQELPQKTNYLFIGPTGCGKTYIAQLLFGEILNLPYVIVDITKYSETGYVGENIINIPARLIHSANGNKYLAQIGVIILDEFDKIASSSSNARFAGAGTTKDVSGYGVQRELLKLLEGGKFPYGDDIHAEGFIDTSNILFIGLGAFSGLPYLSKDSRMGFLKEIKDNERNLIAYQISEQDTKNIYKFQEYGFLPELIARFQRIIPFSPLDRKTLEQILEVKLEKIKAEFLLEGYEIKLTQKAKEYIVNESLLRQTGARGIESVLLEKLEEAGFEIFGENKKGRIIIDEKNGELKVKINFKGGKNV